MLVSSVPPLIYMRYRRASTRKSIRGTIEEEDRRQREACPSLMKSPHCRPNWIEEGHALNAKT